MEEAEKPSLKGALAGVGVLIRWLYFDYMLRTKDATYQRFKKLYSKKVFSALMDKVNDKYADHVEAARKSFWEET